jgi:polar amino acid transport system substrate-binding protein
MSRRKIFPTILILVILLVVSACQPAEEPPEATPEIPPVEESPPPPPVANKLDEILERGTIVISTDPAYPPQSEVVAGAQRDPNTRCAADQRTANEFTGFDIDTAVEIANRLGVEPCFVTPDWGIITSGNWADRWDISIGSMTITPERMQNLYFTQPYYTTPAAFFVHEDNTTFTQPSDLSGMTIGGCLGCTYDFYVEGTLSIPGEEIVFVLEDPIYMGYDTDLTALQDLALGDGVRLDSVMTAQPTGVEAINAGLPIKQLGEPVFFEYLAGAVDKFHRSDPIPLVERLTEIILEMHTDGTLLQLSQQYYGVDLASAAGEFDIGMLNQWP